MPLTRGNNDEGVDEELDNEVNNEVDNEEGVDNDLDNEEGVDNELDNDSNFEPVALRTRSGYPRWVDCRSRGFKKASSSRRWKVERQDQGARER